MNKYSLKYAQTQDQQDAIAFMRQEFYIPKQANGKDEIYLCGNSLGLQPKKTAHYLNYELTQWQKLGVKGHFSGDFPWMPYHEFLAQESAKLVGAKPSEVVCMNSLTTNLHLLMVSFYQPSKTRHKILLEKHAFPSDHYAIESQIKFHGYDATSSMILAAPRANEDCLRTEDILEIIATEGHEIALVLLPGVHYYTGEVLDMEAITRAAKKQGCKVGFDLAHAAGNILLKLHQWQVDFAAWCSYKYLNSGPGSVAGCFVHEKHHDNQDLPRFAGWWGHDKSTRFKMENSFVAIKSAEAWQLSNPPILSLAAIRAALDTIKQAGGIAVICQKSLNLKNYLRALLEQELTNSIKIITPAADTKSGAQLSLVIQQQGTDPKSVFECIEKQGVSCDFRHPDVIRVATVGLYNTFCDVYHFVKILKQALQR